MMAAGSGHAGEDAGTEEEEEEDEEAECVCVCVCDFIANGKVDKA